MLRRCFLFASLASTALLSTCSGKSLPRHVIVSPEKLQQAVAQRFPRPYPVAGLLQLELQAPRLQLLPETDLLKAQLTARLSGPVLKQQTYDGRMEADFSLRYQASDRTVRAQRVKVHSLALDGLPPALAEMLNTYGPSIAEQALGDLLLYQMEQKDLALMDALDMQPGAMRVTPRGLEIALERKPQAR